MSPETIAKTVQKAPARVSPGLVSLPGIARMIRLRASSGLPFGGSKGEARPVLVFTRNSNGMMPTESRAPKPAALPSLDLRSLDEWPRQYSLPTP